MRIDHFHIPTLYAASRIMLGAAATEMALRALNDLGLIRSGTSCDSNLVEDPLP